MALDIIEIGGHPVEVPTTPISSGATLSSILRPRASVEGGCLTLELDRGMRQLGLLFIFSGLLFASLGVLAVVDHWPSNAVLVGFVSGVVCPLVGFLLVLLPRRCVFDRHEGTYQRRSLVALETRPLADIIGVQMIRGRMVETSDEAGTWRQTYELNLVVTSGPERLAVTCTVDDAWVAEAGRAVSEFLGVPLVGSLTAAPGTFGSDRSFLE